MTYEENALAHYGIKGQKWGLRRFQNEDRTLTEAGKERYRVGGESRRKQNKDGSLTERGKAHYGITSDTPMGNSKFAKKYEREMKKLYKADENSDREKQMENVIKYGSKAKTLKRLGNVALGVAIPTAGVAALASNEKKIFNDIADINNEAAARAAFVKENADLAKYSPMAKNIMKDYGRIANLVTNATFEVGSRLPSSTQATGATVLAAAAGTTAAVAYGASAHYFVKSKMAKRRISEIGHEKAVAKRDAQYNKVVNLVKDTPYSLVFKSQIAAYKKEHPNTQLSDKEIAENLR